MLNTVYAMQVDPAIQGMGMGIYDSMEDFAEMLGFGDDFIIEGDNRFNSYVSEKIESILDVLGNGLENYENLDEIKEIETRTLNRSERKRIIELLDYYDEYYVDQEKFRCEFLEAVTGKKWESGAIRGCCQGDYAEIYYVKDRFSREVINDIEAYYFNTGSEWVVYESENEVNDISELEDLERFSTYCTKWSDDGIREQIAGTCYNVNPSDVILFTFDGYVKTPKYEMRIAEIEDDFGKLNTAA